jgi:small subunit ribosomal protein S6
LRVNSSELAPCSKEPYVQKEKERKQSMRKYEVMYIIDQDAKDVKATAKKLDDILTADGAKIVESADWGLRDFAYQINHKKKGHYFVVITETTPANINEFQRIAGIDKDVVRTMVINTESEKRYVQTTKLSKTDMLVFKEERKPRSFDRRGPRSEDAKSEGSRSYDRKPVEERAEKTEEVKKPVAEKPAPAKPAAEKAPAKPAAEKAPAKKPAAKKTTEDKK